MSIDENSIKLPNDINVSICVLAHNEEKHIASTLDSLLQNINRSGINVYVYANGCSDHTADIVRNYSILHTNVFLREISIASKPNAWNAAFSEQEDDFIIFSDGDVVYEPKAIMQLIHDLMNMSGVAIVSSKQMPMKHGLSIEQKIVGFMQLPLLHEFLYGGLYAVRRQDLTEILAQNGFDCLPFGITGEDCFLEYLLKPGQLHISDCLTFYEPPNLRDYCRYLARIKWQNEQLRLILGPHIGVCKNSVSKFIHKIRSSRSLRYLILSLVSVVIKNTFKLIFARKINLIYHKLGPVCINGASVLNNLTRSFSTK